MRLLPILLLVYCLISSAFPFPAYAVDAPPTLERIGDIDQENPAWGEEIIIERRATLDAEGNLILPKEPINVGIQEDQLQFPDLQNFLNDTVRALPFLLPEKLRQDLENNPFPEKELTGKVFHPVCDVRAEGESRSFSGEQLSTGASEVKTPKWWSKLLGVAKLSQAIGVPGFNSSTTFNAPEDNIPDQNQAGGCQTQSGTTDGKVVQAESIGGTTINIDNIFQKVAGFLRGLFEDKRSIPVEIVIRPKKFIQGEVDFANQTSDAKGFLRSFCPAALCNKWELNEQEETPYDDEGDGTKNLEYKGVAGARSGYQLLAQSLYPSSLQSVIAARIGGADYSYPSISDTLDYTIPYRDTSFVISDKKKQQIITKVLSSWPNSKISSLWDQVVGSSIARGINPAFTLAIWIEESGAGGVAAQSQFGCFPGGDTNQTVSFEKSLSCFLNFTSIEHPSDFTDWIRYFCGPQADPICSNNKGFIGRLKYWWEEFSK